MSNISTFYDKIIEVVGTDLFSDKTRLPNPYVLQKNPGNYLKNGWGFKFSSAPISEIGIFNKISTTRQFSIIFSYETPNLSTNSVAMDNPTKSMAEDVNTLTVRLLQSDQLGIHESIGKIEYIENSGLEFLEDDKTNYITTETTFTVDIMEDLQ